LRTRAAGDALAGDAEGGGRIKIRTLWRRAGRLLRRRLKVVAAVSVAAAGLIGALLIGWIPGCRQPEPGLSVASPPEPIPPWSRVVRVRLAEHVTSADLAVTGRYRILMDSEPVQAGSVLATTTLRREGGKWVLGSRRFSGRVLCLQATAGGALAELDGRPYRGSLVAHPRAPGSAQFYVDNHVHVENYLAGVLARELIGSWHQEAYNALAVAARTYAMYEMRHAGRRRTFDVYCDQRSQVYGGVADETLKSRQGVRNTSGLVLVTEGAGAERLIKAYYSSCCGGRTNPAEALGWGKPGAGPLAGGVVCTDCANSSRYRWPTVRIAKADVGRALARQYPVIAALGPLKGLSVASATSWGRPIWVQVTFVNGGTSRVRADDLRLSLLRHAPRAGKRLYSMNCTIRDAGDTVVFERGRGFGHGVGLCQYGTQGKARRGMKYHQILYSYYPGARIVQAP